MPYHIYNAIVPLVIWAAAFPCLAQEKSVLPDINKSFRNPNVKEFIGKFEQKGRDVFDNQKRILAACELDQGMVVADIGAGTGLFTRQIASSVGSQGRVYAVDIAKNFIDHIESTCNKLGLQNVTGVICSSSSVNLPNNSIDLAFICDTYHHFEFPYKTMRSIHRALRPGGQVVLVEFRRIEGVSPSWVLDHVRAGQDTFTMEIVQSGFKLNGEPSYLKNSYMQRFIKSDRKTTSRHTVDSLDMVKAMLLTKTAMLIDVREQMEWDAGHLESASLIPLSQLRTDSETKPFAKKIGNLLPMDKIIYCHCRSGGRVLIATRILEKLGYDIRPLKAGYSELLMGGFRAAD